MAIGILRYMTISRSGWNYMLTYSLFTYLFLSLYLSVCSFQFIFLHKYWVSNESISDECGSISDRDRNSLNGRKQFLPKFTMTCDSTVFECVYFDVYCKISALSLFIYLFVNCARSSRRRCYIDVRFRLISFFVQTAHHESTEYYSSRSLKLRMIRCTILNSGLYSRHRIVQFIFHFSLNTPNTRRQKSARINRARKKKQANTLDRLIGPRSLIASLMIFVKFSCKFHHDKFRSSPIIITKPLIGFFPSQVMLSPILSTFFLRKSDFFIVFFTQFKLQFNFVQ